MTKRTHQIVVIGTGQRAALIARAVLAAGVPVVAVDASREVRGLKHALTPEREPNPTPWDTGSRRRAQWKDETNKRGRSR